MNWSKFVSALTDIGYGGPACIEVETRFLRIRWNRGKSPLFSVGTT
ncbi:MAG: hypothetical protein ACYCYE_15760 [Clostridia bacterium]